MESSSDTQRTTGAETVRWDLTCMYSGLEDPSLDADVQTIERLCRAFRDTHKGNLATTLGRSLEDLAEISMLQNKTMVYLFLWSSTDLNNGPVKAKMAEVEKKVAEAAAEYLTFHDIEIVALDDAALASLAENDPVVKKHLPLLELTRVFKPHLLAENVEIALGKRSPFGPGAWAEFFDEAEADLRFTISDKVLTLTEITHLLSDSLDPIERAEALRVLNDGLGGHFAKYSAQALYMIAGAKETEDRERGFKHPMESRNKSSRLPDAVVESLHAAVNDVAAPLAQRYYRLKAAHLGMKTLKWSDRNAKMPFADSTVVPWSEAVATVLEAYRSFSPTLAGLIERTIADRRIDAPGVPGKRGGAYNYSVLLPWNKPAAFTFLNYLGSTRDVMTLAHELGHGVHGLLAAEAQGAHMFHAPMVYAETASVFGEMTTFNYMKARLAATGDKKALLALIMGKLDDIMNTAVRQISFSNFERAVHGAKRKLSHEDLGAIWTDVTKKMYGKEGDVFTYENIDNLWSYVGHFHNPFYVYAYACGELFTQSLYAKRASLGDRFEPLYLDLLRAGSTKGASELLEPFGLDPTDPAFWVDGINVSIGAMMSEAEALSKEMGVQV